ncbi:MAG: cytotoxic translational repressor of toxin-antitoxin stability system [Actinomycetota bacterium]
MKRRAATRREHVRFCEVEGWRQVQSARESSNRHHLTFELPLDDGRILRTRISRPPNNETYSKALWAHILRDQLCVTQSEFWTCVDNGHAPVRSSSGSTPPPAALPAGLAHQLVHVLKLSSPEIAKLSLEEATALMNQHWSQQSD